MDRRGAWAAVALWAWLGGCSTMIEVEGTDGTSPESPEDRTDAAEPTDALDTGLVGCALDGRVVDEVGDPRAGVRVTLLAPLWESTAQTRVDGTFELTPVLADVDTWYSLELFPGDEAPSVRIPLDLSQCATRTVEVRLPPRGAPAALPTEADDVTVAEGLVMVAGVGSFVPPPFEEQATALRATAATGLPLDGLPRPVVAAWFLEPVGHEVGEDPVPVRFSDVVDPERHRVWVADRFEGWRDVGPASNASLDVLSTVVITAEP